MAKLYFKEGGLICYPKEFFLDELDINEELEVFEAIPVFGEGLFWCSEYGEIGESITGICGKNCDKYIPRNGKNGRCKFSKTAYEITNNKIILTNKN